MAKTVEKKDSKDENGIPQMKPGEVLTPENDLAVLSAAGVQVGEEAKPNFDDSKESNKKLEEQDDLVADISSGDVVIPTGTSPQDIAVLSKPMVPDPISGRPVYETSEQWRLAAGAKGELLTEGPKQ